MYEKKIPEDLDCGINITMKVLGGKWKACILDAINKGVKRPSEMHRLLNEDSPRVINMQLAELHEHRLISKKVYAQLPLKVEYSLTPLGESLLPLVSLIDQWGISNRDKVLDNLTVLNES